MNFTVTLPRDRYQPGVLRVFNGGSVEVFNCACLGKADNAMAARNGNPNRDPLKRYGDFPLGEWRVKIGPVLGYDTGSKRTYGPHPVLTMEPVDGDALRAYTIGKRTGILKHGGAPNAKGGLRPTNGCLRLSDADQSEIVRLMREDGADWFRCVATETE